MSVTDRRGGDTGTGYGRPRPTFIRELTEVGAGTPMGELLRRYWHPVGLAGDATATPSALRVLGEDLVLFRDAQGRAGLVYARCAHRGTTLWEELTPAEHQKFPGDYEAQVGQGAITFHSEEHLVSSDKGVAMVRRMLGRETGVSFDESAPPVRFEAGNFLVEGTAGS
jgi:hypothetical protein